MIGGERQIRMAAVKEQQLSASMMSLYKTRFPDMKSSDLEQYRTECVELINVGQVTLKQSASSKYCTWIATLVVTVCPNVNYENYSSWSKVVQNCSSHDVRKLLLAWKKRKRCAARILDGCYRNMPNDSKQPVSKTEKKQED
ncbi:hypothetical protein Tco_0624105 [Tanacetum coccineum]|uniref:Uncharacterized protein n=1 Tax=Tanacetum coccineum TaxID=301880 RepID=A0ABQ4WD37_9ASTR